MGKLDKLLNTVGNVSNTAGAVIGGVQAVKSLFGNQRQEERNQDARQVDMQRRLNLENTKANKELADYEQQLKMQMWKDTNYGAQLNEATKAGLSKVAVLGGSGGGTQGASVGTSGIGSGASGSAQSEMARTQAELAKAQTANLNANTMKTTAETKKIGGVDTESGQEDIRGKKINNDILEALKISKVNQGEAESDMARMEMQEKNIRWEALKSAIAETSVEDPNNPLTKSIKAEIQQKITTLDNMLKQGRNTDDQHELMQIEKEINGFTADLSGMGLNPTTTNIITTLLKGMFGMRTKGGAKVGAKGGKK